MSDVVERTLSALPGWLGQQREPAAALGGGGGGGGGPARPGRSAATSRLGGLIRSITALASKHEEEKLIHQELNNLKATVSAPTTTLKLMKECMVRMVYCEMLGYEASFGYIHAIKLAQQGNLFEKRVGYLAISLFLHENHELLVLLVNTVVKEDSSECKDLTSSFVTILKQVVGGKLPADYNYHNTPAPWLQIQLLRILRLLGKDDPRTSELMYEVLDESLRRAEINHNITYAILFECVHTIYTIHPKSDLLEKAAKCIGKFVLSPKINLKYLVIECLEHPDPIIKRETLELLYRITNEQNVTVIVQKMLDYINQSKEEYTIINIAGKIAELAEKYPFFFFCCVCVLLLGFEDEKEDVQLRFHAVQSYLSLLEDKNAVYPQKFLQVMSWVLGEYSYLLQNVDPEVVLASLYRILKSNATSETKAWIVAAISKTASRATGSKTVDASLSFLDGFVAEGLDRGALPYKPHHQRQEEKLSQEKEGYLPQKKSPEEREEITTEAALQGGPSVETVAGTFPLQPKEETTEVAERTNEKQRLASALFMGKADSTAQKFTRKLKMNEAFPNESSLPMESSTTTSLFPEALTGKKDLFLNNGHLKFRKASLNSAEMPEYKTVLDRAHSLPEGGLNEKSLDHQFSPSSLFTHGHMDVFHPSPSSPTKIRKQLLQLTPRLPEEASQHPHSDISELCSNESLLVYFSKVWKEDRFLVFLFLANKSASILKDVRLEFQHSEHFKMVEGLSLAVIESKNIERFQMYVEMEKPCSSGKIFGCISYPLESDVHLRFSISLELLDFIRPMKMSTDEYGKLWLSISNEVKQNLKVAPSQGTLSMMLDILQQKLKLHIVDII
ncbi:hypothetical protein Chor_001313, partial [Crotalus horridus]